MNSVAHETVPPGVPCVTRFELARLLQVSLRTVDRMIANGDIRVRRVHGWNVRFLKSDVDEYLRGKAESASRWQRHGQSSNQDH